MKTSTQIRTESSLPNGRQAPELRFSLSLGDGCHMSQASRSIHERVAVRKPRARVEVEVMTPDPASSLGFGICRWQKQVRRNHSVEPQNKVFFGMRNMICPARKRCLASSVLANRMFAVLSFAVVLEAVTCTAMRAIKHSCRAQLPYRQSSRR